MYDNGYDFFQDLIKDFGKEQAIAMANNYLDMQLHNTDPEEFTFCCELYQATKNN